MRIYHLLPFIGLLFLSDLHISAQRQAIKITTDNDLYTSTYKDGYYTNGLFIDYLFTPKEEKQGVHKIYQIGIGQEMYNAYKATIASADEIDRPYAGVLYAKFSLQKSYTSQKIFRITGKIGAIGELSLAKESQDFIHLFLKTREIVGWNYQIADALVLNWDAHLSYPIFTSKRWDFHWINDVEWGSLRSNANTGIYARYGIHALTPLNHSIALNNNLSNSYRKPIECFLFLKSQLEYQYYDATIEGSCFNNNSPITFPLMPFIFKSELGIQFTLKHFNCGYTAYIYTQCLKNDMIKSYNYYGTLDIAWLF